MTRKTVATGAAMLAGSALLAACGSGSMSSASAATTQGITAHQIDIGTVLPLTGGAATAAEGVEAGLKAAVGQVNAKGGIGGRTVKLTVLDDNYDPATHVADFKRLVSQDKVYAVLVPAGTANLPGEWPVAKSSGIPDFAPYLPSDPGLPSVFILGTGHQAQAEVLAKYLAQQGDKTVGFIGEQDSLGTSMLAGLKSEAAKDGMQVTSSQFVQPSSTDMSSAVLNVKATNPQAVILGTDNTQSALILKQAAQLQWHPVFAGDSSTAGTYSKATASPAGAAADGLLGAYFSDSPTDTSDPAVSAWKAAEDKYAPGAVTATNGSFALQGYAFAEVFFHILSTMGKNLSWSNFDQAAENLKNYQVGLIPPVTFGPLPGGHTGTDSAKIARYQSGTWTSVTPNFIKP